jgi:hypothetical protein
MKREIPTLGIFYRKQFALPFHLDQGSGNRSQADLPLNFG